MRQVISNHLHPNDERLVGLEVESTFTKTALQKALPIRERHLTIRAWNRTDLDLLANWPLYPFPYKGFEFCFKSMSPDNRDRLFAQWGEKADAIPLVLDHSEDIAIGFLSLSAIEWTERRVGNFGFRIHPNWVNQGIGTSVLRMVSSWLFDQGIQAIGVDVAASNARAVRCYEKVGFHKVGEIYRPAEDLKDVDISAQRYDFLRPHVRLDGEVPKLRFYLMELKSAEVVPPKDR